MKPWDMTELLDEKRLRLRMECGKPDVQNGVQQFLYAHPITHRQLLKLMPKWMPEKTKRVRANEILRRLLDSGVVAPIGEVRVRRPDGKTWKEKLFAGPAWFCPCCVCVHYFPFPMDLWTCRTIPVCDKGKHTTWRCPAEDQRCDQVPLGVKTRAPDELVRDFCISELALSYPNTVWVREVGSSAPLEASAIFLLESVWFAVYARPLHGWDVEAATTVLEGRAPECFFGQVKDFPKAFIVEDESELQIVTAAMRPGSGFVGFAEVLSQRGIRLEKASWILGSPENSYSLR